MRTQTLSHVTLQSIENYRTAAVETVAAYRVGSRRLVGVMNGALQNSVYPRTAMVAPRVTDRMDEVRGKVSDIVVKGIDQVAEGAEKAIELSSSTATSQLTKVAKFAAGIDNEIVANGLQAAARLTMPGAKVALLVSTRVAEGATALADAAGAHPVRKVARKAVRKAKTSTQRKAAPMVRKAKASIKTTTRRVTKAVKAADAPVAKVQRAARKATQAAAEVVTA
ncbi:MAG TPA: hypothetical protein PLA97_00635 [Rubrivivax sp.]|nr:hypothetical protein [Rubrivivax sp.]